MHHSAEGNSHATLDAVEGRAQGAEVLGYLWLRRASDDSMELDVLEHGGREVGNHTFHHAVRGSYDPMYVRPQPFCR